MTISPKLLSVLILILFLIFTVFVSGKTSELVNVTLAWQPATDFENGDALSSFEIEEYIVKWSSESGEELGEERVGPGNTHLVLKKIEVGTYVFTIKSISVYGTESKPLKIVKRIESVSGIL